MVTSYTLLLFIHIGAATIWIGSAFALEIISLQLGRHGRAGLEHQIALERWFGPHVFMPVSLLTLLAGIGLVFWGGFGFTQLWIILALLGIALAVVMGALGITRHVNEINDLLKEPNPDEKIIQAKLKIIHLTSYASFVLLLLILLDMIIKPTL
jgi:uncharacterized membrane protein